MQKRIKIKKGNEHLRIMVGWRSGYMIPFMASFIGIGICCLFGAMAASSIGWIPNEQESSVPGFLFSGAVSVLACYGTAAYCLNFSVVDVSPERLLVRSEPIPFPVPRGIALRTSDVTQLFVEQTYVAVPCGEGTYGTLDRYDLCALLQDGERTLLLHFSGKENGKCIARLIEEHIEQYLGIEDQRVEGEEDPCKAREDGHIQDRIR